MNRITSIIKNWIRLWPDIWAVPVILIGVWASYYIMYWIDPSIGTFDLGILQALLFTVVILVVINAVTFLGIEFNDKDLWSYYKRKYLNNGIPQNEVENENDFELLQPWQRIKLLFFWRAFLFSLGVVIFLGLI